MADDQRWPAPSRDEVGGLLSPGAAMPSLPNNPSKRPGKKCSRGAGQLPSLLGQAEQPRGVSEVHCAAPGIPCFDGL